MSIQIEPKVGDLVTAQQEDELLFSDLYGMDPDVNRPILMWDAGVVGVVIETSHVPWEKTPYKGSLKVKVLVSTYTGWIYADYLDVLNNDTDQGENNDV